VTTAPRSGTATVNQQLPDKPPPLVAVQAGEVPCVQLTMNGANGPTAQLGLRTAAAPGGTGSADPGGSRLLADQMVVAPGAGLLIRNQPAPGVADGALYLLVDIGVRYPMSTDAVRALGYDTVNPTPVPAPLLDLVPTGPPLDPAAAHATEPMSTGAAGGGSAVAPPAGAAG
jgi:hypothetical protein